MSGATSRRGFIRTAASAALATAALGGARGEQPPNVLFFFDDQLRNDAVGYNGSTNCRTPNIDRFARQGVVFTNALSTCPLCTPYRGMLHTGRYPTHTGIVLNWTESNPRERCIAEYFGQAGYHTGFIGKWHLAAGRLKHAGEHCVTEADRERIREACAAYEAENPETEYVPPGPARQGYEHWQAFNFHSNFREAYYYEDSPERLMMDGYETDAETDMAIEYMRRQAVQGEPFFLAVAPHPPHPPWHPTQTPEGFLDRIPERLGWRANVPEGFFKDETPQRCYYAMIENVDHNFGRLLEFLDESGLADNTIVVLTSDHGEMMGSHGRMNKMVPYAEAIDIPLIIRFPGVTPEGHRSDELFTPMDHLPTLMALAGIGRPEGVDGLDLSAAVTGASGPAREEVLMMNYTSHWDYFDSGTHWPEWRGLRTRTHTYCKWLTGEEELYDNTEDPCQQRNLAEGQHDLPRLKHMRRRLVDHLASAHDEFPPGTAYADWYDDERNLIRTALGAV